MTTAHFTTTQLCYAEAHLTRAIESLEHAGDEQFLARAIALRSDLAARLRELVERLPESSGTKRAARMYGGAND